MPELRRIFRRRSRGTGETPSAGPLRVRSTDPAAAGRRVGRSDAPRADPRSRATVAITRFNSSRESATVVGLTRTLGQPSVSIGSGAGGPSEVRITVAWEFSWYQWGVDTADPDRPVYAIAKGTEITELDAAAKQWNASTTDGGLLCR